MLLQPEPGSGANRSSQLIQARMTLTKASPFKHRRAGRPEILNQRPGHPPILWNLEVCRFSIVIGSGLEASPDSRGWSLKYLTISLEYFSTAFM